MKFKVLNEARTRFPDGYDKQGLISAIKEYARDFADVNDTSIPKVENIKVRRWPDGFQADFHLIFNDLFDAKGNNYDLRRFFHGFKASDKINSYKDLRYSDIFDVTAPDAGSLYDRGYRAAAGFAQELAANYKELIPPMIAELEKKYNCTVDIDTSYDITFHVSIPGTTVVGSHFVNMNGFKVSSGDDFYISKWNFSTEEELKQFLDENVKERVNNLKQAQRDLEGLTRKKVENFTKSLVDSIDSEDLKIDTYTATYYTFSQAVSIISLENINNGKKSTLDIRPQDVYDSKGVKKKLKARVRRLLGIEDSKTSTRFPIYGVDEIDIED